MASFTVSVKFGKDTHELGDLEAATKVSELMTKIELLTNVFVRCQKLIHKGKILSPGNSLSEAKIAGGSKLMLMAAKEGFQSTGQTAAAAVASRKAQKTSRVHSDHNPAASSATAPPRDSAAVAKQRAATWTKTGIIGLRDGALREVPESVWAVGDKCRVMDLGGNGLPSLPPSLSMLRSIQRLRLSGNQLTSDGLPWEALGSLSALTILALDDNLLTSLDPHIGRLSNLKVLTLARNKIAGLPEALGSLPALETLTASSNALEQLTPALSGCRALIQLDVQQNAIPAIPEEFAALTKLQFLLMDGNKLQAVPPAVLKGCVSLHTLTLHANPISVEVLREVDGYKEYDARRQAKCTKQLDMRTLLNRSGFDEGADAVDWSRH